MPSAGAAHEADQVRIAALFAPYRITANRLRLAAPEVLFLPCPPVHRGEEVSADAMEAACCRVYEAKNYLLHAQNALLLSLLA